jgi:hypothetical protein
MERNAMPFNDQKYGRVKLFLNSLPPYKKGDARLIAAAPELLSVCQAMAGDLQALLDGDDFSGMNDAEMFGVMLRSLRAAIAKAEGSDE